MQSFLAKIDPADGSVVYKEPFGLDTTDPFLHDVGLGIAVDSGNHFVYVTGFAGPDYSYDVYLAKFGSAEDVLTQLDRVELGTTGADNGVAVALDPSGNVYVTGEVEASLDGQTHHGMGDVFVARYGPDLVQAWSRQFGSVEYDKGKAVQVSGDLIYVSGYVGGNVGGRRSHGGADGFITAFDPDGAER